jgi:outer membrane receptor protein involved in Fe transport
VTLTLPFNGDWMTQTESKNSRFAGGFLFNLPHGWRAIADYTWNYGTLAYTSHAGVASTDITSFINAGTLNPFVDTTAYPINYQQYQNTGSRDGDGGSGELALRASGPLGTLPGGSPTLSVGLVGRNEGFGNLPLSTKFGNYPGRAQADLLSISVGKRQSTGSGYAEIQAPLVGEGNRFPLVHALTLQAAIRYENYKVHTGTASITVLPAPAVTPVILKNTVRYEATSPTAGFSYRPFKDLMFRVSYGKGFVTPTYAQLMLNETLSTNLTNISDPKRGNATYGVTTFGSGNPDLTPETSKSWNAGVIYEPRAGPLKGLRAGLEYSLIRKSNNIGSLTAQQFVQYEDLYPGRVTRATPIAGDPFGVGQITTVNIAQLNLLKTLNENFDATLAYRVRTERLGSFDLSLRGTFANHFTKKISATTPNVDFAGFTNSGQIKFQGNGYVAWDYRQWTAVWSTRFYSHFRVNGPPITTSTATIIAQGGEFVPSQSYSDVLVTYRFDDRQAGPSVRRLLHGLELQVGVINVFNKTPSFDLSSFVSSYGYSTWGDIRLREYRLSIKKTF